MQELAASTSANLFVPISERERITMQRRRFASASAALGATVLWFLTLARLHVAVEAMPWYVTSTGIAVACACAAMRREQLVLVLRGGASAGKRPLSLLETWAATYLVCAIGMYAWVLAHALMPQPVPPRMVQVVDIELTSPRDFANRESPMPGTEEQTEMHQRRSDNRTVQGDFAKVKAASTAKVNIVIPQRDPAPPTKTPPVQQPQPKKPDAAHPVAPTIMQTLAPSAPAPHSVAQPIQKQQQKQPFVMEEIQPPEMVELIENDGEADAARVFQTGGSTAGGKGAANELSTYIKELHKRIKAAWAPPRGQSREARILFRIRRDGTLAFVRVQLTSGDAETDDAALRAVTLAVRKQKALPEDYSLPFLDVQYTFKYTADELKEVQPFINSITD